MVQTIYWHWVLFLHQSYVNMREFHLNLKWRFSCSLLDHIASEDYPWLTWNIREFTYLPLFWEFHPLWFIHLNFVFVSMNNDSFIWCFQPLSHRSYFLCNWNVSSVSFSIFHLKIYNECGHTIIRNIFNSACLRIAFHVHINSMHGHKTFSQ